MKGFTEKYKVNKVVYFEETSDIEMAIAREKEIKRWRREKKNALVVSLNPHWNDLSYDWVKDFWSRSRSFEMTRKKLSFSIKKYAFVG